MATLILKTPARRVPLLISARRVWTPWTQQPARPCPCPFGCSARAVSTTAQRLAAVKKDELTVEKTAKKPRKKTAKQDIPAETPSDTPADTPEEAAVGPKKTKTTRKRKASDPSELPQLIYAELRDIAALCGRSVVATKPMIRSDLKENIIDAPAWTQKRRVLSIDMGVRNLAYCLLEVDPKSGPATLLAWERLSLIDEDEASQADATAKTTLFSPPRLAAAAARLVQERLLDLKPTHVVIERQRARSGGGMAVLEWTIRVNALEAMLHGIFAYHQMLHEEKPRKALTAIEAVSPKRVSVFLLRGGIGDGTSRDKCPKTTATKEKDIKDVKEAVIAGLLRTAVENKKASSPKTQDVLLSYSGPARMMVTAYLMRWDTKQKRLQAKAASGSTESKAKETQAERKAAERRVAEKKAGVAAVKELKAAIEAGTLTATVEKRPRSKPLVLSKIDDLADCVAQGLIWLEWERNKAFLRERGAKAILDEKQFPSSSSDGSDSSANSSEALAEDDS